MMPAFHDAFISAATLISSDILKSGQLHVCHSICSGEVIVWLQKVLLRHDVGLRLQAAQARQQGARLAGREEETEGASQVSQL